MKSEKPLERYNCPIGVLLGLSVTEALSADEIRLNSFFVEKCTNSICCIAARNVQTMLDLQAKVTDFRMCSGE